MRGMRLIGWLALALVGGTGSGLGGPAIVAEPKQPVAEEAATMPPPAPKALFSIGVGYLQAQSEEIVYGGNGPYGYLSELIWDVDDALTIDLGLAYDFTPRFGIFANGVIGLASDNTMVDFDWLGSGSSWTDRSTHPDTDLDHYYQVDIGLSYRVLDRDAVAVSVQGGFRYTDIAWSAYGGDYIYSSAPDDGFFRDDRGSFPDGELGISYRQEFPGFYLGPQVSFEHGRWAVDASGLVGVTVEASDKDRHWERDLIFYEEFGSEVFYGATLGVEYAVTACASLYLRGAWDYYPVMKGTTEVVDTVTGEREFYGGDAAGASLESWQVRAGLLLRF